MEFLVEPGLFSCTGWEDGSLNGITSVDALHCAVNECVS